MSEFQTELERLINQYSMENGSDTPDFILAQYMADCLAAFEKASRRRDEWWGHDPRGPAPRPPRES